MVTDKRYSQKYKTIYLNYGLGASAGINVGGIKSKKGYKATFSDWAGESVNGISASYEFISLSYGHTSQYQAFAVGVGLGYNYKGSTKNGTYSLVAVTTLIGSPTYIPPAPTNLFMNNYIKTQTFLGGQ